LKRLKILFLCGSGGPNYQWSGRNFGEGIGGSEGCLIRLAEHLALAGHTVCVSNNCGEATAHNGVVYTPYTAHAGEEWSVNIAWRNWYLLFGSKAHKKLLWGHDVPVGAHHPCQAECERPEENALETIDKIVYLNNYHRSLSPWWPDEKSAVIPIGVEQFELSPQTRDPARCVTFYHPNRGLHELRRLWPQVKAAVPEATLQSYWWEPEHWLAPIPELGILPMQKLGQADLYRAALQAGVFAYPSVFGPEISPASTIIAQMGGAYPCVVIQGGMVDTVQFGARSTHAAFVGDLISVLQASIRGELEDQRQDMMQWASETYNWENVAKQWINLMES
jgi:glycosyltransferase involved in cell wall biosynthesis